MVFCINTEAKVHSHFFGPWHRCRRPLRCVALRIDSREKQEVCIGENTSVFHSHTHTHTHTHTSQLHSKGRQPATRTDTLRKYVVYTRRARNEARCAVVAEVSAEEQPLDDARWRRDRFVEYTQHLCSKRSSVEREFLFSVTAATISVGLGRRCVSFA